MRDINIAITAASYSGNKGAAAMLQSSIHQLYDRYGESLNIRLMSVYPDSDKQQVPFDFVKIVSQKPEELVFSAFPCACLYWAFKWFPPLRFLLSKHRILKSYLNTDLVIDEAGISFVDSRGFVMNTYAFICLAVPLLVGTPVVKYSQALGSFDNPYNRFLAKLILPKLSLICARGQMTYDNLKNIGISDNVRLCADGAFTMPDDPLVEEFVKDRCKENDFWDGEVIGVSLSSVVDRKCSRCGIDYRDIMAKFINYLTDSEKKVMIIANAARIGKKKPRNNDLIVCDDVYLRTANRDKVLWYHEEMRAEEIREYVGRCKCVIASRFHLMIGALQRKIPVLLIGWSHKYQEVLDMFGLGKYAEDYSTLNFNDLVSAFDSFYCECDDIQRTISNHYEDVMRSSRDNIVLISEVIDTLISKPIKTKAGKLDYYSPNMYLGTYLTLNTGYSLDSQVRENAASGGLVTGLLLDLLDNEDIDGAWVTRTVFDNGKLSTKSFIATTSDEILECGSSVYIDIPHMKYLDEIERFSGKIAVVLIPCMMLAFDRLLESRPTLREKIVIKIGLFCSGTPVIEASELSIKKAGIDTKDAERLYFRKGHWRGNSFIKYRDGSEKKFPYKKYMCAYKNAYFFALPKCMKCTDHFAECADVSFGDVWLKEMRNEPIKHTGCVIRSERAYEYLRRAQREGRIVLKHISASDMIRSQKRALVFKYLCNDDSKMKRWNHRLVKTIAEKNMNLSIKHPETVEKLPSTIVYLYMCFIRFLLSF